ncbi:nuclease [Leptospira idonii]|uniref:Nuclease n=2 Tax=Leptospira idonii TaxID=1193500 RepID=A0A4R9LX17_9LEPT|nr:nuclease [Leptospira idonii]
MYKKIGVEFYCGCPFDTEPDEQGRFRIFSGKCGLKTRTGSPRSYLVEWEHIVPAHAFGKHRECWTKPDCSFSGKSLKGRKCCEAIDPEFKEIEADLHNLVPAPGEINNDRGNYFFAEIEGERREYGTCDFEVDFRRQIAEPRPAIRGDIARIYFYMEKQWGISIPPDKRKIYEAWNKEDPTDTFEIRRNDLIEKVQGRRNPFID